MLIYRDVVILRISNQSLTEQEKEEGKFVEKEVLTSLYHKNKIINIEVFFYQETEKMSIIGSMDAFELFQNDPKNVPF